MNLLKILKIISYYLVPITLIYLTTTRASSELGVLYGRIAEILIIIALFIKPLSKILNSKILKKALIYRRQLGVAAFWFFIFHAGSMIILYNLFQLHIYFDVTQVFFWGALGGIGMIILGLTSNKIADRILKKNWKKVQVVAYPTLFAVIMHSSKVAGNMKKFYIIGGLFILLKFLEWRKISIR